MVKSATYHVWDLFQNHTGPVALPVVVDGPGVQRGVRQGAQTDAEGQLYTRPAHVPYLDVAATLSEDRQTLHLSAINRHRSEAIEAQVVVDGRASGVPARARGLSIGADVADVLASNSTSAPETVALRTLGTVEAAEGRYAFLPHSLTLLSFALG